MKRVIVLICIMLLLLALAGCGAKSALVGKWYYGDTLCFTFYSDGTCKVRGEYGLCEWDIVDGELKIVTVYKESVSADYEVSGNKLTINGTTFTKK